MARKPLSRNPDDGWPGEGEFWRRLEAAWSSLRFQRTNDTGDPSFESPVTGAKIVGLGRRFEFPNWTIDKPEGNFTFHSMLGEWVFGPRRLWRTDDCKHVSYHYDGYGGTQCGETEIWMRVELGIHSRFKKLHLTTQAGISYARSKRFHKFWDQEFDVATIIRWIQNPHSCPPVLPDLLLSHWIAFTRTQFQAPKVQAWLSKRKHHYQQLINPFIPVPDLCRIATSYLLG